MVFGFFEKHWQANEIPDQTGRVAVVTGGNTGLGYITVLELARKGAKVYMASRSESRAKDAIEKVKKEVSNAQVEFIEFDLSDFSKCKSAADEIIKREGENGRLDIVINNAGIMATPYELSKHGIELQACNGVGHFAFTVPLLPLLKSTASKPNSHVRIVNVSSMGHKFASNPNFDSLENLNQRCGSTWGRYGNSKLTNILFSNELAKRLQGTGVLALSIHPGVVATELNRGTIQSYPILKPVIPLQKIFLTAPADGALTQLYAATSLEVESKNLNGAYLVPIAKVGGKSSHAVDKDAKLGQAFWSLCENLISSH